MNPHVNVNSYDEINVQLHNGHNGFPCPSHLGHFDEQILNRSNSPCLQYVEMLKLKNK